MKDDNKMKIALNAFIATIMIGSWFVFGIFAGIASVHKFMTGELPGYEEGIVIASILFLVIFIAFLKKFHQDGDY